MSWIDYYGLLIILWYLMRLILVIFKRTRTYGLSASFSTIIFFLGVRTIQNSYDFDSKYVVDKRAAFSKAVENNDEIIFNLSPQA